MKILPTKFNTAEYPPTCAADFIGDAREAARKLERIVDSSMKNGFAPIKLMYSGPSGIGKTSLCLQVAATQRPLDRAAPR